MGSSVGSDFDTIGRHFLKLLQRVGLERNATLNVVRKGESLRDKAERDEVSARNLALKEQRNRMIAIVGIPIVERDTNRRASVLVLTNSMLSFVQRNQIAMFLQPVDLAFKERW